MSNYVNLVDIVYPVGSVYISFHSTSPASSIGGTWTQITDKVLRASTNTNTGGEDTHKLTVGEMPPHTHHISTKQAGNNIATNLPYQIGAAGLDYSNEFIDKYVESKGDGKAHNNLPAYQNCYVWHRTA